MDTRREVIASIKERQNQGGRGRPYEGRKITLSSSDKFQRPEPFMSPLEEGLVKLVRITFM